MKTGKSVVNDQLTALFVFKIILNCQTKKEVLLNIPFFMQQKEEEGKRKGEGKRSVHPSKNKK